MLYPDFNDLVAYKDRKSKLIHTSQKSVKSITHGNHRSPFRGQGLEFDSVREYVLGDDIRRIDWRVTARTGSPHLKLFKEDRERHMILCVDVNSGMRFGTRNTFKSVQAARAAALLGWQGLAQHDGVSACLFGDVPEGIQFFPAKRTRKSFCAMLKMLSEPLPDRHCISISDAVQQMSKVSHTGSLIYLISDFLNVEDQFENDPILSRLNQRCDVVFVAINDQADKAICPIGTIGFRSSNSEIAYVNTDSSAGQEAYAIQWKEHRQKLSNLTSKLKISLIELTTESDIQRDLPLGLKAIAKRKKR